MTEKIPASQYLNMPWYAGKIARNDADAAILKGKLGDFLVRESATVPGSLTLVAKSGPMSVRNDRILYTNEKFQVDGSPKPFDSLQELLNNLPLLVKRPGVFLLHNGNQYSSPATLQVPGLMPRGVSIAQQPSFYKKSTELGTLERSGGQKHPNVIEKRGHLFFPQTFLKPTACSHCHGKMFGWNKKGVKCKECGFSCHSKCLNYVHFDCPGSCNPSESEIPASARKPHEWSPRTYLGANFCDLCGGMLFGLLRQGCHCENCNMNVHKKCMKVVPNTCGFDFTELYGRIYLKLQLLIPKDGEGNTNQLILSIGNGVNLISMDPNGFSDPYVRCAILPDPDKSTKVKTAIHRKTLNPHFNENFAWDILASDFEHNSTRRLHISVMDWDFIGKNEFMGTLSFSLSYLREHAVDTPQEGWFKLLRKKEGAYYHVSIVDAPGNSRTGLSTKSVSQDIIDGYLDRFDLLSVIGKGSFGKVFLAKDKTTGGLVAIKALKKTAVIMNNDVDDTFTERDILSLAARKGTCPFMTQLIISYQDDGRLYLAMEFISGGDLMFHIKESGKWDLKRCIFYVAECVAALFFLHRNGVIYRDLKLDNILITTDGHLKLADFGMSKEGMKPGFKTKTFCGTPDYIAPEILKRIPYDFSVDFWALGVLFYEMITGAAPFNGYDDPELFHSILFQNVEYPRWVDPKAVDFISRLLTRHPPKRLGCGPSGVDDIKNHELFAHIDWVTLENGRGVPPFRPKRGDPTKNFESMFTNQSANLSFIEPKVIDMIDQDVFADFDYIPLYRSVETSD